MADAPPAFRTRPSLRTDIEAIGVRSGDTLLIHAAVSRVGTLLNGPDALIGALRDVLGTSGTLMGYTDWDSWHTDLLDDDGRVLAEWRDRVPPFDPVTSRAARSNGIITEFLRTTPGALRSGNSGASMAAIGARAEWLTANHAHDYGYGESSPLAKLVEAGGRCLMIGAPWDTMTLIHYADHLAEIPGKRVLRHEVPLASPAGTVWRMIEEFDTSQPPVAGMPEDYIGQIVTDFVAAGNGSQGPIGAAPSLLVEASALLDFAVDWLESRYGE